MKNTYAQQNKKYNPNLSYFTSLYCKMNKVFFNFAPYYGEQMLGILQN